MSERKMRKDAEERKQTILKKAALLFAEYGVEQVSMRQIAREAGVGQGTLYRSYTNKGDLCWDLIGESCIQNNVAMQKYLKDNPQKSVRERLETVLTYHLESLENHSPLLVAVQAGSNEEQRNTPIYSEHYESVHAILLQLLSEIEAAHPGMILDPVFSADMLMASMQPDIYLFLRQHRGHSAVNVKQRIFNVYIDPLFPDGV